MRTFLAILAGAALVTAAAAQPQPDLIARIHFLGGDNISADTNHLAFTNEFCSAEAKALEAQTLDKLSRAPGAWFKSKIPAGAGDGSAQLRPMLDDLLKSEWIFEMRDTTNGSPEYALAIRLGNERAAVWSKNLSIVLQGWTGVGISQDKSGIWELKKHAPPNLVQFSRSGDWVVVDCGQDKLSLGAEILWPFLRSRIVVADTNWFTADLNWPRLAQLFPALKKFDFPKSQMQVAGSGTNLQFKGRLVLAQPLPPLESWRIPTNTIHQPLVSFTAARGVGPWLARQRWMQPLKLQPQPDQLFIWALERIPFQTFAAEPVPDAGAALVQLDGQLNANTNWQGHFMSPLAISMTGNEISFGQLLFIAPYVKPVHEPAGDFLVGGLFQDTPRRAPLAAETLARLGQPGLVYFHWENTAGRLEELPQLSQLLLTVTRHRQLDTESVAGKWLARIKPALGGTVTEAFQTAPDELAFTRNAPGGLTALELLAFVDWLDGPNFPAADLRVPMSPRPKFNRLLPAFPGMPAAPTPAPAIPRAN